MGDCMKQQGLGLEISHIEIPHLSYKAACAGLWLSADTIAERTPETLECDVLYVVSTAL